MMISTLHIIMLCIPMKGCSAFCYQQNMFATSSLSRSKRLRSSTYIYSSTTSSSRSVDKSIIDDIIDDRDMNEGIGGLELWIDLRGTSLTPKTALELWELEGNNQNECSTSNSYDMDCLPRVPFVKCLVSSLVSSTEKLQDYTNSHLDILLVANDEEDGDMPTIYQQTDPSSKESTIGKVLTLQRTSTSIPILPDPLPSIELVSRNQWVIIDTNNWKKINEEERIGMVLPMMELISSGFSTTNTCGGVGGGGIGITCHTNNEIVKAAMFIRSLTNGGGSERSARTKTKTLDSGIVIPDDSEMNSLLLGNDTNQMQQFAIIVPFDMELLRTFKLMFAK